MLEIQKISDDQLNVIAPSVFIDGVELENDEIRIYYSVSDPNNSWIMDQDVLSDVNLYIVVGSETTKESLNSILKKTQVKNNTLKSYFSFKRSSIQPTKFLDTSVFAITSSLSSTTDNITITTTSVLSGSSRVGIAVTAFCAAESRFSGVKTIDPIIESDRIITGSFENTSFNYINKIKNLDILNINNLIAASTNQLTSLEIENIVNQSTNPASARRNVSRTIELQNSFEDPELLVSYNPNKTANFGIVFDLEKFLLTNSKLYNILKNNDRYKREILYNSRIVPELSFFYKKNITKKEKEYYKINNQTVVYRLDDSDPIFFVGTTDDNKDITDFSYYSSKIELKILDASSDFVSANIKENTKKAITFLKNYINLFTSCALNKDIVDINEYIFSFEYQSRLPEIESIINSLAPVCSLFSGNPIEQYLSLFTSIFHPLTTRTELLQKLLNYTTALDNVIDSFIVYVAPDDQYKVPVRLANNSIVATKEIKKTYLTYEKQYSKSQDINKSNFNYDYVENYGIEVISPNNLTNRLQEKFIGIKVFTAEEDKLRSSLEARKYYTNPNAQTRTSTDFLSISHISFGVEESYDLINNLSQNSPTEFNNLFVKTNEYNDFYFNYKKPETYYFQISNDGINIKSLSNRNNKSTNNLLKNTLFDPNTDSAASSKKFLSDVNLQGFYFLLDENKFINLEPKISSSNNTNATQYVPGLSGSIQYGAYSGASILESPIFIATIPAVANDNNLKSKKIVYYNSIYKKQIIYNGNNIAIYKLNEAVVNDIFTKKLRLFNGIYAIQKKAQAATAPAPFNFNINSDLRMNILPKYLNRISRPFQIDSKVEQL